MAQSASILRADKSEHTYKRVCMDFAADGRLSWEARGVMSYLLSKSDDWRIVVEDIINQTNAGRDKVYRILDELQRAGYLSRHHIRDERGRVQRVEYQLLEVSPLPANTEVAPLPASPLPAQPYPANPTLPKVDIDLKKSSVVASATPATEQVDEPPAQPAPKISQPALLALPDTPTPVPAPPAPKAPRKRKAQPPTPETLVRRALLAAWEKGPNRTNNARVANAGDALMELDPAVTPERIATFAGRWFVKHSDIANAAARRGDPVTPPTPEQTLGDWPRFQAWERAQAAHEERERRRREEAEASSQRPSPEEVERARAIARRGFLGLGPRPDVARPALTALGRRQ